MIPTAVLPETSEGAALPALTSFVGEPVLVLPLRASSVLLLLCALARSSYYRARARWWP